MVKLTSKSALQSINIDTYQKGIVYSALLLKDWIEKHGAIKYRSPAAITITSSPVNVNGSVLGLCSIVAKIPYTLSVFNANGFEIITALEKYNDNQNIPTYNHSIDEATNKDALDYDTDKVNTLEKFFVWSVLKLMNKTLPNITSVTVKVLDNGTEPTIQFNINLYFNWAYFLLNGNLVNALNTVDVVVPIVDLKYFKASVQSINTLKTTAIDKVGVIIGVLDNSTLYISKLSTGLVNNNTSIVTSTNNFNYTWVSISGVSDLSIYDLEDFQGNLPANRITGLDVPTNLSQLNNDVPYVKQINNLTPNSQGAINLTLGGSFSIKDTDDEALTVNPDNSIKIKGATTEIITEVYNTIQDGKGILINLVSVAVGKVSGLLDYINSIGFIKTINGNSPDVNGNINIIGGSGSVTNDDIINATLTSFTPFGSQSAITASDSIFIALRKLQRHVTDLTSGGSNSPSFSYQTITTDTTAQVGVCYLCEPSYGLLLELPTTADNGDQIGIVLLSGMFVNINNHTILSRKNLLCVFTFLSGTWNSNLDRHSPHLVLLNHFEGLNNEQSLISEVGQSFVSTSTNTGLRTADKKFGNTSLFCGGSNVVAPVADNSLVLAGDFTIEFWFKCTAKAEFWTTFFGTQSTGGWAVRLVNTSDFFLNFVHQSDNNNNFVANLSLNIWYHVAFSNRSNALSCFVNGVLIDTLTIAAFTNISSTFPFILASFTGNNSQSYRGYLDELRIFNGIGLYNNSFSVATIPYIS